MSGQADSSIGWGLWLRWVLANVAGVVAVLAVTLVAALIAKAVLGGEAEDKVPFVPMLWLGLGIAQWLVLRRHVPQAGWWVLASAAGWLGGFALLYLFPKGVPGQATNYEAIALLFALALGASLGVMQWLVLRRHFAQAGWWVLASIVAWVATLLVIGKSVDRLTDFIALAVVPPAITGLALIWLVRRSFGRASNARPTAP